MSIPSVPKMGKICPKKPTSPLTFLAANGSALLGVLASKKLRLLATPSEVSTRLFCTVREDLTEPERCEREWGISGGCAHPEGCRAEPTVCSLLNLLQLLVLLSRTAQRPHDPLQGSAPKTLRPIRFPHGTFFSPIRMGFLVKLSPSLPTQLQATLSLPSHISQPGFSTCTADVYFSSFSSMLLLLPGILMLALVTKRGES